MINTSIRPNKKQQTYANALKNKRKTWLFPERQRFSFLFSHHYDGLNSKCFFFPLDCRWWTLLRFKSGQKWFFAFEMNEIFHSYFLLELYRWRYVIYCENIPCELPIVEDHVDFPRQENVIRFSLPTVECYSVCCVSWNRISSRIIDIGVSNSATAGCTIWRTCVIE